MNNPLMGWDRNGEDSFTIGTAILIAAIIGCTSYTLAILVNTGCLRQWSIFDFGKAVIIGGVSGAATFGIGELFKVGSLLAESLKGYAFLVQGGMQGASQGIMSLMDGGNFFQGFVSGALGSISASGWSSAFGSGAGGMIAFGALAGGIGAELSGGNFFKGFLQGGIVAGLNHFAHATANRLEENSRVKTSLRKLNLDPKGKPDFSKEAVIDLTVRDENLNQMYKILIILLFLWILIK